MTANPKDFYTLEEYLELERNSDEKYEYWDGQVFCMSGGTKKHFFISDNVFILLSNQLAGKNCQAMSGAVPIKTTLVPPYKYPDGSVVCGEPKFETLDGIDILVNPMVIIEVLSPSTERIDRGPKFTLYKSIPSFVEYLLVAQDNPCITHFIKKENNEWKNDKIIGMESMCHMPSIECTLKLSDVYRRVQFDIK